MGDLPLDLIWELFGLSILATLVAGLVAPLVGSYLLARRTGFLGIVLPQLAAAGVAFGYLLLPWWTANLGHLLDPVAGGDEAHLALSYHLLWAGLFTAAGLGLVALAGRHRDGTDTGTMAAAFALASALTVLFVHGSPVGDIYVHSLLRGEILAIDIHELEILALTLGLVAVALVAWFPRLTRVGLDPDGARVLGDRPLSWELVLALLVGATVSVSVMTVGPVVLFGLLVMPPLVARSVAWSMASFLALSSLLGLTASAGGVWLSFTYDLPLGPAVVVASAVTLVPVLPRVLGRRGRA